MLRARCLKYFESFDLAWAELNEVLPHVKDPLLEARVAVDLLQLSYYLVRREETPKFAAIAQKHAAGDPLMLAEFYLGNSTILTAQNEITSALQSARRAEDALLTAPKGRARDLVVTRVQRQLAHLLSHSGDYVDATAAADATVRHAARVGDPWEAAWAVYTTGFVDWAAGRIDQAVDQFTKAEASLRTYGSSVWRYTCLCLARARMERGEIADGDRLARQSATGAAEDHAHLALLRGEADVADRILTRAPIGFPEDEQFRNNVRAIVRAEKGDPRGGEGFAYYLPEVAAWLGKAAERDPAARELARKISAQADAALRRAKSDSAAPVGSSALDEATFYLRTVGLTWRELGILREMELLSREGKRLDRASLADRLGVSPNTLRVHLTRIRAKLDVGDKRGDEVLLSAALTQRPVA